jgi:hypothetical protein
VECLAVLIYVRAPGSKQRQLSYFPRRTALEPTGHLTMRGYALEPLAFTPTLDLHVSPAIDHMEKICLWFVGLLFFLICDFTLHVISMIITLSTGRNIEGIRYESGEPHSIVETSLDPEPQFDIDESGGHMSLQSLRLKATVFGM